MNASQLQQVNDVKEQIAKILRKMDVITLRDCGALHPDSWSKLSTEAKQFYYVYAESILKIDGLAIIDKDQTPPKPNFAITSLPQEVWWDGFKIGQDIMISDNSKTYHNRGFIRNAGFQRTIIIK